jgi:hypothetical protein
MILSPFDARRNADLAVLIARKDHGPCFFIGRVPTCSWAENGCGKDWRQPSQILMDGSGLLPSCQESIMSTAPKLGLHSSM